MRIQSEAQREPFLPYYEDALKKYHKLIYDHISTLSISLPTQVNLLNSTVNLFDRALFLEALEHTQNFIAHNNAKIETLFLAIECQNIANKKWKSLTSKHLRDLQDFIPRVRNLGDYDKNLLRRYHDECAILLMAKKTKKEPNTFTSQDIQDQLAITLFDSSRLEQVSTLKELWTSFSDFIKTLKQPAATTDMLRRQKKDQKVRQLQLNTLLEAFVTPSTLEGLWRIRNLSTNQLMSANTNTFMPNRNESATLELELQQYSNLYSSFVADSMEDVSYAIDNCKAIATNFEHQQSTTTIGRMVQLVVRYCNLYNEPESLYKALPDILSQLCKSVKFSLVAISSKKLSLKCGCLVTRVFLKNKDEHTIVAASIGDGLTFCYSPDTNAYKLLTVPRLFRDNANSTVYNKPTELSTNLDKSMIQRCMLSVPSKTILIKMTFEAYRQLAKLFGTSEKISKNELYKELAFDDEKIVSFLKDFSTHNPQATAEDYRSGLMKLISWDKKLSPNLMSNTENQLEVISIGKEIILHVENLSAIYQKTDNTITIKNKANHE